MKIGLDGRFWSEEAAGLSRYSKELVYNLLKIDKKNEYFLFLLPEHYRKFQIPITNNQTNSKLQIPNNLKVVQVHSPHYSISEQIKLPFELNKVKLDFIHFLSFNHPVFWPGKFVVTIHDLTLFFYPGRRGKTIIHQWAMESVMKDAVERAIKIIVPSKSTKKDLINKFKIQNSKIKVTYEGVPEEFKRLPAAKISQFKKSQNLSKPFLLYIGQWRPHKNLERLVEAFEITKSESKRGLSPLSSPLLASFQLVIAGKPDLKYRKLLTKIKKSKFRQDIICPGFIKDKDLPLWYNAATVFIFPSLYEGFGLPPLEAMACGTPVLSSNSSSMPEVLGDAAMYFDPENVSEMAKNIVQMMKEPELRKILRKKGLEQVKKFSFQKMAEETLKVYNRIS